jgi:hypothetical protein
VADETVLVDYDAKLVANVKLDHGLTDDVEKVQSRILIDGTSGSYKPTDPNLPVGKVWGTVERTLVAGVDTLTLSALSRDNLPDVNMDGEKIRFIKLVAAEGNTAGVKFIKGATNGYQLFGSDTDFITLLPGWEFLLACKDKLIDVDTGVNDTIDVSSTQANAKYKAILISG